MAAWEKYEPRCRVFLLDGAKFRTNLFVLFFDLPLKRETATKTALLAEVLKHEDWERIVKQAEELYGALWDVSVVKKGDRQLLLFSVEALKACETSEVLSFLQEKILHPLEEGTFSKKTVERQKKNLLRKLKSLRDDKKAYARKRALEETAEGTDYAISEDGYEEDLEKIDAEGLFLHYRDIVEQAMVKVFYCGNKEEKGKILTLRQLFPGKLPWKEKEEQELPKNGPRFLQEHGEMEQARLLLGFSADVDRGCKQAAMVLLNHLLGGSPDSLLFQKIREEQGLCYDVKSDMEPMSPYLFVQTGIRVEDAKEVGKQVLQAVEYLKKEAVSGGKLEQAKGNILRQYDGMADSPWAMVDFFAEQVLQEKELTSEKILRQIKRTDAEDISQAAAGLELRVVYLISGKEQMQDAE